MLRPAIAILLASHVFGKTILQTPLVVDSLGRNVELDGISYFIPGWPEVRNIQLHLTDTFLIKACTAIVR
jgi:hypothetical protein